VHKTFAYLLIPLRTVVWHTNGPHVQGAKTDGWSKPISMY